MSVIKAKRSEGRLEILTQANNLAAYTVQICKNEKYFPKRDRWIMTQHIAVSSARTLLMWLHGKITNTEGRSR